jgi:FkbM family methyltransferase
MPDYEDVSDKLIMDVGAHTGADTEFYLHKGFKVVAIEAYPPHAMVLRQRFEREIVEGRLTVEEIGIADQAGLGDFFVHAEIDVWHRASPDPARGEFQVIQVPFVTFDVLLDKYPTPYYLKIDIEGNDECVLNHLTAARRPAYVSFEIWEDCEEPLRRLNEIGYTLFQIANQKDHGHLKAPFPPREGAFVDPNYDNHITGLFGRELPEDGWCDLGQVLRQIEKLDWTDGNWYDVHAAANA